MSAVMWVAGFFGAAFFALIIWFIVTAARANNVGQRHDD